MSVCPHCGCAEFDDDAGRGDIACVGCGALLEESAIVSQLSYVENAGGGYNVVGQFVPQDRPQPTGLSIGGVFRQDSREVTYSKGKRLIISIANQLHITPHCVDTAFNFFKMCVSRNLTRGRIRSHVVAACLYITCRLENTSHLLLDFSDITQVNVFDLGRTLTFVTRSLRINLPSTDPCLYILRFAILLKFKEKEKEVVSLATRLVQRMKRDSIATGRRPTGLCGAALLLAARRYNFNRTINDIVNVVHVSEAVVRKRLDEFGQTPSSELTIDEFATIDLERTEDPPAFRLARKKNQEQLSLEEEEILKNLESEIQPMEEEVEKALEQKRRERFKKTSYAKMLAGPLSSENSPEMSIAEQIVRDEIVEFAFEEAEPRLGMSSYYAPSLQSLGISDPLKPSSENFSSQVSQVSDDLDNGELDLAGINDDEIDTYILSNEEVELKSKLWMKVHGEHLFQMEKRQRERAEEEKDGQTKAKKRRYKNSARKKGTDAATFQEAVGQIIQEKKLSKKINYDLLNVDEFPDFLTTASESELKTKIKEPVKVNGSGRSTEFSSKSPKQEFGTSQTGLKYNLSTGSFNKNLRRTVLPNVKAEKKIGDFLNDGAKSNHGVATHVKSNTLQNNLESGNERNGKDEQRNNEMQCAVNIFFSSSSLSNDNMVQRRRNIKVKPFLSTAATKKTPKDETKKDLEIIRDALLVESFGGNNISEPEASVVYSNTYEQADLINVRGTKQGVSNNCEKESPHLSFQKRRSSKIISKNPINLNTSSRLSYSSLQNPDGSNQISMVKRTKVDSIPDNRLSNILTSKASTSFDSSNSLNDKAFSSMSDIMDFAQTENQRIVKVQSREEEISTSFEENTNEIGSNEDIGLTDETGENCSGIRLNTNETISKPHTIRSQKISAKSDMNRANCANSTFSRNRYTKIKPNICGALTNSNKNDIKIKRL